MKTLKLKYLFAKLIDFVTSASIITFIYNLLDQELNLEIEILIVFGVTFIPMIMNFLLFKFFGISSLGETILGIKKKKDFKIKNMSQGIEKETSIPKFNRIINTLIALIFTISPFFSDAFITQYGDDVSGLNRSNLIWKSYKHPEDEWKIEFPTKPVLQEKDLQLPNQETITLNEVVSEQETLSYSISSATLPDNLLKWSPNLILKGSIKILDKNHTDNSKSTTNKIFKYKNFASLPYFYIQKDNYIFGRLILANSTLYKLEVECPIGEKDLHNEKVNKFFNSFNPS